MAGKISGPGSAFQPGPNPNNAQGVKDGQPDPNALPVNHPGSKSDTLPGQAPVGSPTK